MDRGEISCSAARSFVDVGRLLTAVMAGGVVKDHFARLWTGKAADRFSCAGYTFDKRRVRIAAAAA